MSEAGYRRMLARREQRRSRSVAVSVGLALLALGGVYLGIECVLAALRVPALLVAPSDALREWSDGAPLVLAIAGGAAVLGVILIIAALGSGRRRRHRLDDPRSVILIDDDVFASAVSMHLARGTGVATDQVRTSLGRRRADVLVRPTSGHPLDPAEVESLASVFVTGLHAMPAVRTRTRVSPQGVVSS